MSKKNLKQDPYVPCPFYKKEETTSVRCEGPTEDSRIFLQFEKKVNREKYQDRFCRTNNYKKCGIYKMLMEKYE